MPDARTSVDRDGRTAIVRVRGDVVIPTAHRLHDALRSLCRRRDTAKVVVDFAAADRLDSAGIAVIEVARRAFERAGKQLELVHVSPQQRAAFELSPPTRSAPVPGGEMSWLESIGDRTLAQLESTRQVGHLVSDIARRSAAIAVRRARLPTGSVTSHVLTMGADGVFIVTLLTFLLGLTIAFQGVVQLSRFGAGMFVADMVGWSMVREFAPLITAVVLSGRTGAAIAAELGAMRVNQEIDALRAMGVSPTRYLVVPRLVALTLSLPGLTVIAMFVGIFGGAVVAAVFLEMSPGAYWMRVAARVDMADFLFGFSKSFVFAWVIGLAGCHLGLRASGDASSVGAATTRTVVASIFFIIVVDSVFATVSSIMEDI